MSRSYTFSRHFYHPYILYKDIIRPEYPFCPIISHKSTQTALKEPFFFPRLAINLIVHLRLHHRVSRMAKNPTNILLTNKSNRMSINTSKVSPKYRQKPKQQIPRSNVDASFPMPVRQNIQLDPRKSRKTCNMSRLQTENYHTSTTRHL